MLIRHSFFYLLARGLPGLVNFAALLIYTRLLSPEDYGRYTLIIAGVSMAEVVVFQWQRLVLVRWLSAREEDPRRFLGKMLYIFALLALVAGSIGMLLALLWPDPVWQRLLVLAVLLFAAQGWVEFNLTLASAQLVPARYGWILGGKTLLALAVGAALAWFGLGAYAPPLGLLAGCLFAVPLAGLSAWYGVKPVQPDKVSLHQQLSYGLPLVATFVLGWIVASSDRLIIGWLLSVEATGQYAVGYDLAQQSLGMLLVVVQTAAYPLAVRALEERGLEAAVLQVRQNGELIISLALAGAAGIAVLAPQLAAVTVGHEFRAATESLLPPVALAAALGGIKAFYFDVAFHLGRNSSGLVISSLAAAAANLAFNLALIPRLGIQGAAYATVAAYLLGLLLSAWLGRRVFAMPPSIPLLLRASGVAILAAGGAALGGVIAAGFTGLLIGILAGALAALVLAFLLDLASLRTGFSQWRHA